MHNLTVSVIIVVQNGERYLSQAIESVIWQTHQPIEILVVDGNSSDNTAQIAKSYPKVRYICQQGKGLADARNTGIENASGELIAFLDHDDYWALDKLAVQRSCFISSPIQYSYANVQLFLESGREIPRGYRQKQFEQEQIGRTPGTLVARKSLFNQIGKFNPSYRIGCDVEWFVNAQDCHVVSAYVSQVLLYKRIHCTNLSGNTQTNKEELLQIIKQSLGRQRQFRQ